MAANHERLMAAAREGSAVELRVLLRAPGCDALAKGEDGLKASGLLEIVGMVWPRSSTRRPWLKASKSCSESRFALGLRMDGLLFECEFL